MTTVLLQAMKSDPPADYKCRDKFLVQSIAITADREATNVQQIVWASSRSHPVISIANLE